MSKPIDFDRWERIHAVFVEALNRSPGEWPAYLDQVCAGDPEIRREVEELLASDQTASREGFLDPTTHLNSTAESLLAQGMGSLLGRQIGPYRVIERIGQWGMGQVYRAERVEGFEQGVAIKVLAGGTESEELPRRFHNEVQIQAALGEHPNIVRLIDVGVLNDAHPYFVMDFVDGDRIDTYCDRQGMDVEGRLRLFLTVCDAVAFAHRHAVIHRDLKPSNILVTRNGVPNLIDFGIAKLIALEGSSSAGTLTSTSRLPMTPLYASPEQVRGEPLTTASDVYSLGVTLYELLTGRRPYEFRSVSPWEIERVVCSQEPERPSLVVGRDADPFEPALGMTASPSTNHFTSRPTSSDRLRRRLAGDLDTIVLTALRKETNRRYPTVEQFAEDLICFLEDRPIWARRDSIGYRLGKFVQRNRGVVGAGILVVLTLIVGIVGTTWAMLEAIRQRDQADENLRLAQDAVDELGYTIAATDLHNKPGASVFRENLLEKVVAFYEVFLDRMNHDPRLMSDYLDTHRLLAMFRQLAGQHDKALLQFREAIQMSQRLMENQPDEPEWPRLHSGILNDMSQSVAQVQGLDQALPLVEQAIAIQRDLLRADPGSIAVRKSLATSLTNLGGFMITRGDLNKAGHVLLEAFQIRKALPNESLNNAPPTLAWPKLI